MGQILAGPFAGTLLAYFGAEVIKLEPPGTGDALRGLRIVRDGTSLWWHSVGRNKKSVTLDLRKPEGRRLARRLLERVDVVVENFRPGTLERWGLGPEDLEASRPDLVWARISGYGQTGPHASRPGFASVCEGAGGLRHLTGFPGQPPVRSNLSLGDSLAGLHAAFGVVLALLARERGGGCGGESAAKGQVVDVAITESVFNLLEAVVPEYDGAGVVRGPSGSTVTGIVPSNTYPCRGGEHVIIGANGDSLFRRLMAAAGRPDLAQDPRLQNNAGRVEHQEEIDAAVAAWTATLTATEVLERMEEARVPAGPIYTVADLVADPHFQARGLFEEVEVGGRPLKIPAVLPKLTSTPGRTLWPGPALGAHTEEILGGWLDLGTADLERLREGGVI
jgi:crotonobetainyl-CoA:carnitine CoA-transferase CaiB-like acyl-CoA transferase